MVVLIYDPLLWNTSNFLVVQPYMKSHVNKTQDVQYSLILHFRQKYSSFERRARSNTICIMEFSLLDEF